MRAEKLIWEQIFDFWDDLNLQHFAEKCKYDVVCTTTEIRRKKAFLRENLCSYISVSVERKKFKFGEVSLQICQSFLKEIPAK